MSFEDRYILWNYMLAEHCLLADSAEGVVLLTVTPQILTVALDEAGETVLSPGEAEADFIDSVANVYRERVLGTPNKLSSLKSTSIGDVPFCVGFLALSVLAAFHMRTDEEYTGRAFYPRLAEMLKCDLARALPLGFDGHAFLELWDELGSWLKKNHGRELGAPDAAGTRRYVAFPFAHVPLREVDIERLPYFFDTHGYEPGARAPLDRIAYDLYEGSGPWRYFTEAGRSALEDRHRRSLVVRQVARELDRWDGCRMDSAGVRGATIELWMDVRRRRPQLYLLARRPVGFPDTIEEGELFFESSQEGWYEPVPLERSDGPLLERGVRVGTRDSVGSYRLQLRQASVVPLTPSEAHTGFVSDRALRADTECAVLCVERIADDVDHYLSLVSRERPSLRRDDTLPAGWCLFTNVKAAANRDAPPRGLESLQVESSLALIPEGGLRLGRRWVWLESAPARLTVLGSHDGLSAKIDSKDVDLDDSGHLTADLLRAAGKHVVEIGNRLRQRITVLEGTVSPSCISWRTIAGNSHRITVPAGRWVLLGKSPGDAETVSAPTEGALTRPRYNVQWAVQVGAGPGASALHIHDVALTSLQRSSAFHPVPSAPAVATWAETIHQTAIRRPRFFCVHGCKHEVILTEWRRLTEAARKIKRSKGKHQR